MAFDFGVSPYKILANSSNITTDNAISFMNSNISSGFFAGLGDNKQIEIPQLSQSLNIDLTSTPEIVANDYLKKASEQKELSSKLAIASGISDIYSSIDSYKQVKNTKYQYEQQKRVMDLNIKNTESLLLENYKQTMSDLDASMAAKNVDLSSQGIVNMKRKGLMNIGEDIALQNQQNDLNKAALDLQYAYQKSKAKTNMTNSILSNAFSIGIELGWL